MVIPLFLGCFQSDLFDNFRFSYLYRENQLIKALITADLCLCFHICNMMAQHICPTRPVSVLNGAIFNFNFTCHLFLPSIQ